MTQEQKNELLEVIKNTIASSLASGEPSASEISDLVIDEQQDLISKYGYALAVKQVRLMVSTMMKKVIEIVSTEQFELPFGIENVPPALSFAAEENEETVIRYIPLSRAKEFHLQAYLELLKAQIDADTKRYRAAKSLYDALAPAFEISPDATIPQACKILREKAA